MIYFVIFTQFLKVFLLKSSKSITAIHFDNTIFEPNFAHVVPTMPSYTATLVDKYDGCILKYITGQT